MDEEIIVRPKTNCVLMKSKVVACSDYLKDDGTKDLSCCNRCGWNPVVSAQRLEDIYVKREFERKLAKRRAKYAVN